MWTLESNSDLPQFYRKEAFSFLKPIRLGELSIRAALVCYQLLSNILSSLANVFSRFRKSFIGEVKERNDL
jgi:hypothetical protein